MPLTEKTSYDYAKYSFDHDVKKPCVPCLIPLPRNVTGNLGVRIRGKFKENAKILSLLLLEEDGSTSPLTITIRPGGWVLRIDYTRNGYGTPECDGKNPFQKGGLFDILIISRSIQFEIFLDDKFFTTFAYRSSATSLLDLEVRGDVVINLVTFHHYNVASDLTLNAAPPLPDSLRGSPEAKKKSASKLLEDRSRSGLRLPPPPKQDDVVKVLPAPQAAPQASGQTLKDPEEVVPQASSTVKDKELQILPIRESLQEAKDDTRRSLSNTEGTSAGGGRHKKNPCCVIS